MPQGGIDFGFVGESYEAADADQDTQRLINWYVEISKDGKSKTPTALLGCPGLQLLFGPGIVGPVRGAWVLPGGQIAIVVIGSLAYTITVNTPATPTSPPTFGSQLRGSLLTSSGPVVIRDNGAGGYAVIVDGQYGYYYHLTGITNFTFSATPTLGSVTLPYTGTLPTQLVVGQALSGTGIAVGATVVSVSSTLGTVTMSLAATASPGLQTITGTTKFFDQITDPAFLGADRVEFIDGWLIFNQPGTQNFYTNAPVPYTLLFDGTFFAKNDSSSDNIVTHESLNRDLWIVGERHTEIWYDAGGSQFAFQRIPGAAPELGCAAKHSITKAGDSLMWLAKSARGGVYVIKTQQYSWVEVTSPAVANIMSNYFVVSDAVAFCYEEQGHEFYVLTFPMQQTTWVYDLKTELWHQRARFENGQFFRHRANCFMNFQDLRVVGDYANGNLYQLTRNVYTDDGQPLVCVRRCPHIWSREDRERVFHGSLQIEFKPGVGLASGADADVDPHVIFRFYEGAGESAAMEEQIGIGKIGETRNRAMIRRLGVSRDRLYEIEFSAATKRDIVGATLYAEGTRNG